MMQFWAGRLPFFGYIIHWRAAATATTCAPHPTARKTRNALADVADKARMAMAKQHLDPASLATFEAAFERAGRRT